MASVAQYWKGNIQQVLGQVLGWLLKQAAPPVSGWMGNLAVPVVANRSFYEMGLLSNTALATLGLTTVENIAFDPPAGVIPDSQGGPDGFPINYAPAPAVFSPLTNFISIPSALNVTGRVYNPLQGVTNYRVDIFAKTDIFYYMGSSSLSDSGLGWATFEVDNITSSGTLIGALYPTSVPQPSGGWSGSTIPAGWIAHTNTGIGPKLTSYKARLMAKTDIEYLQEDSIPIIVQDTYHARAGSSVVPNAGTPVVQVLYNDPVAGWTTVFDSLQTLAAYQGLPRSLVVPTSDPHYVQDIAATQFIAALQNRSWTYDAALALLVYSLSGNFAPGSRIIANWENFLANPGYLPSVVLENAEDGLTSRWSKSDSSATIANVSASSMTPTEPPNANGQVIEFTSALSGDYFSLAGSGFPDATDTIVEWWHLEPTGGAGSFAFDIGVTTASNKVTTVEVNSSGPAPASYNAGTKTITIGIGYNQGAWSKTEVLVGALISELAGDTLSSITSFKATLNYIGNMWFDNFTVGTLQPTGSLAFSYDVYFGEIADAYLRTGAQAWAAYAWAIYMQQSQDYTSVLSLQSLLNYLLTQQSTGTDMRSGLFYLGYGKYVNPGYQFVPGALTNVSGEHNLDIYNAFTACAKVLPTAIIQCQKLPAGTTGYITAAQAATLTTLVATLQSAAATVGANWLKMFYTAPSAAAWQSGHSFALGDQVQDANGNQQKCVVAGTSGGSAPSWSTTFGNTTADNTVTWQLTGLAGDPGHFAEGINSPGTTLDVSHAADVNTWAAPVAHALGNDTAAVEALKFAYKKFYVTAQTIALSNATNSWNEAYQQATPFSGIKNYNDSPNGYSGSPTSSSQEQTWGYVAALLTMYANSALQSYFNGIFGGTGTAGLDQHLGTVIADQGTIYGTTNDGSFLGYSLASRDLPWEFNVWEMIAPTAWFWLAAQITNPLTPLPTNVVPYLIIPKGQNQSVSEKDGSTSIGQFEIDCIDPSGIVKGSLANPKTIGMTAQLKMFFPGQAIGDAVPLHTVRLVDTGFASDGKITITAQDPQAFIQQVLLWSMGGPNLPVATGGSVVVVREGDRIFRYFVTGAPLGLAYQSNGIAISDSNPRWLQAHPLDLLLVALQNELGVGQDPALEPVIITTPTNQSGSQMGIGFTPNPNWQQYCIGDDSTLINPNPYLDVSSVLQLRDTEFSGYWFDFKITRPAQAKQWIEDQLLKPLGLFFVTRADGRLSLKSMKAAVVPQGVTLSSYGTTPWWNPWPTASELPVPAQVASGVFAFTEKNIIGLPSASRLDLCNSLTARMDEDDSLAQTSSRSYQTDVTFINQDSVLQFRQFSQQTVESYGIRSARGGLLISELLARRIFERHAFRAPVYNFKAILSSLIVEVGDYVWMTHSKVPDLVTGKVGISSVLCEVIDRQPDYAAGNMTFKLLDTRPLQIGAPYQIAPAGQIPAFGSATAAEKAQYMYISSASSGGENSDGTAGNAVF